MENEEDDPCYFDWFRKLTQLYQWISGHKVTIFIGKVGALRVMVANGENMICVGKCKQLAVSLGSLDIYIDFYIWS